MMGLLKRYGWMIAAALALFWLAFSMLEPPPPKSVRMASGGAGGAYAAVAERYRVLLDEVGVELEVLETNGSVDNIARIVEGADAEGAADIAIVQTGLADAASRAHISSLGAVYYEPLWIFHRSDLAMTDLRDLAGKRVAIGGQGSGSRALTEILLADNDLSAQSMILLPLAGQDAVDALKSGKADAAMIVAGAGSDWIMAAATDPAISIHSLERSLAYSRRHPFLSPVILPEGALSLSQNLPVADTQMAAPSAQIVVRHDLHPAIHSILLDAMAVTHADGTLLASPGTFPRPVSADFELSKEARRYYENGPSFLRRFFPFDIANFLERAWVLLIPLATLAFPIVKAAPPLYRWRVRRKIYVWYRDLRLMEEEGRSAETPQARLAVRARLAELQEETGKVEVPDSYTDDLYRLRAHIRFVSELLDRLSLEDAAARV